MKAKNKTPYGIITVFFFLSGLTGLTYELLWTRMIVKVIGAAPFAVSVILTIFMGGLGVGSFLAGRQVDKITKLHRLIAFYGLLEIAVGLYGILLPHLISLSMPFFAAAYNRFFGDFMLYSLITFFLCTALLILPVICMGATLPILCKFYVRSLSNLGSNAGRLYGVNTIGAACGAFICGFWLIAIFGVTGTLVFAVTMNLAIGILSVAISYWTGRVETRISEPTDSSTPAAAERTEVLAEEIDKPLVIMALVVFAVSGFCAMSHEVLWTRLLGLLVAPTTYSFTIVLVTFITGLALGSMLFGYLGDRTRKPFLLLVITQALAALIALIVSQFLGNSQLFFAKLIYTFKDNFSALSFVKTLVLFVLMLAPTVFFGATFPLVGKICTRSVSRVGTAIGFAYLVNTIGAVAGSFCSGFLLIPLLGKENSLRLLVAVQLLITLSAVFLFSLHRRRLLIMLPASLLFAAGVVLCLNYPRWNRIALAKGAYHRFNSMNIDFDNLGWIETISRGAKIIEASHGAKLVYYGDGVGGFTTVIRYPNPLGDGYYTMAISGKSDATSYEDMRTQTLLAHFPMLFHPHPRNVMVVGLASGVTSGEVLNYPVEEVDTLEISRQVIEASKYFRPWNNNVLQDPRSNIIVQDALAHLRLTNKKYDVIISEPSNPWMAGLAALFTMDCFQLARNRLDDNGIFVQFLHSYEMDWPTFSMVGRSFVTVFPNSILAVTHPSRTGSDYLLVGVNGPKKFSLEDAAKNLPYAQMSDNVRIPDSELLCRFIVSEDLDALFGPGPLNTDDMPRLEFSAPKLVYDQPSRINDIISNSNTIREETRQVLQRIEANVDKQIELAEYALAVHAPFAGMVNLDKADQSQKDRLFEIVASFSDNDLIDFRLFNDPELAQKCRRRQVEILDKKVDSMPDPDASYFHLADTSLALGDTDKALEYYQKSYDLNPNRAELNFNFAVVLSQSGNVEEARRHFELAAKQSPNLRFTIYRALSNIMLNAGSSEDAIAYAQRALVLNPRDAVLHNNLGIMFAQSGNTVKAIEHFAAALRIDPDFEQAQKNLAMARRGAQSTGGE